MWGKIIMMKDVEIVIADSARFKSERSKYDIEEQTVAENAKSVGDINRVSGKEAGDGVFGHEILKCPTGGVVK
jgi:hypothetical protein